MSRLVEIANDIHEWDIQYRIHATKRMFQRNVDDEDVLAILFNGDIIERYEDDYPFPSVLINGRSGKGNTYISLLGLIFLKEDCILLLYMSQSPKSGQIIFHGGYNEMRNL